jgi:hypothetical protein
METEQLAPLDCWVVVDRNGSTSSAKNEDHARAKVICHDVDYPNLAPHRAVHLVEQQE